MPTPGTGEASRKMSSPTWSPARRTCGPLWAGWPLATPTPPWATPATSPRTYGRGFKQDVLSNVVSREADVRAAVGRVALGDADATLGYASDYTPDIRERVEVIEIPEDLNIVATYPVAVLKDAESPELAREWVDLVVGAEGQRVLKKWGFEPAAL